MKNTAKVRAAAERRRNSRCRVAIAGLLKACSGDKTFECKIRDLSATGARVALRSSELVPRETHLINMRDQLIYDATIAWRTTTEWGLIFKKAYSVAELADPKLVHLKEFMQRRVSRCL